MTGRKIDNPGHATIVEHEEEEEDGNEGQHRR